MRRAAEKKRRIAAVTLAGALILSLSACSVNDDLAADYREGSNKGYVSVGFSTASIAEADRNPPIEFAGVTEHGDEIGSDDTIGDVTVVNFWYAACGPCIAEAPVLEEVWQKYKEDGVQFVGVNIYDEAPTAISFANDNGVTYPSIIDIETKDVTLAFAAEGPLQAPPVTLVLDREGRVAARIIGQIKDPSILSTFVRETLAEPS